MRFTHLPDERRLTRLPRLGKIRLGVKKRSTKGKEYPDEVDYFVMVDTPEVAKICGAQPKELPILLPVDDPAQILPHRFCLWGSDLGLRCQGDGRQFSRVDKDTGEMVDGDCPTPGECDFAFTKSDGSRSKQALCIRQGTLSVILPTVSFGGVYQIDTTSYHAIQGILDDLAYIHSICMRVSWLMVSGKPLLWLVRRAIQTHGSGHKETHWPMRLELRATPEQILAIRQRAVDRALTADPGVEVKALPAPEYPPDLISSSAQAKDPLPEKPKAKAKAKPEPEPEPEPVEAEVVEPEATEDLPHESEIPPETEMTDLF